MGNLSTTSSSAGDLLNSLKNQEDFCQRVARLAADESKIFKQCVLVRARIDGQERTLERLVQAAKVFKNDGLEARAEIEDLREKISALRIEYRGLIRQAAQFQSKIGMIEAMAIRQLGLVPYYASIL